MEPESNDKGCYPFQMNSLPNHFRKVASAELNESPQKTVTEMEKFKNLLSVDQTTAGIDFNDDFLKVFLRHTKYNTSKALSYLRNFVNFRRNYSSLFTSIPDEYFDTNPSTNIISILPYRCPDGCAIVLSEIGKWNPEELSVEEGKKMMIFLFLQALRCPVTQISGFKVIHDFKDASVKYLRYATPQNLHLIYDVAWNCVPGRYKEIHLINESVLSKAVWSIMKLFLSAKMKKRVVFHSKPEELLNYFPSSVLPSKYGGSLEDYHDKNLLRRLNEEHGNYPIGGLPNYF